MGFILTWLQTAVKVEYDHDETSQGQGKNHPDHSGFPHPESLWKPPRSRAQSCQGSGELHGFCRVYFTGRGSIDPARCSTFAASYLPGHPRMPGQEEAAVREDEGGPGRQTPLVCRVSLGYRRVSVCLCRDDGEGCITAAVVPTQAAGLRG